MTDTPNRQSEIFELQTMLRLLSQADSSIPSVNPDGIFGEETERAVLAFQSNMGLSPTGTVDFQTWCAITAVYRSTHNFTQSGVALFPFPPNGYTVERNEKSDLVRIIQSMLSGIGVVYDAFSDIQMSGIYDETTENAVRLFQRISHLPQTGLVDVFTWNRLAGDHNIFANNPLYTG